MWRILMATALTTAAVTAVTGFAAALFVLDAGNLGSFTIPVRLAPAAATVDIKPESLQKKSHGQPMTAFIELPEGFHVSNIRLDGIRLCLGQVTACTDGIPPDGPPGAKPKVGDADSDGIPDLKVTFDRAAVIALVADVEPPAAVTFTISGIVDPPGSAFAGSDTVNLLDPEPEAMPSSGPEGTPTPTAEYQIQAGDTLTHIAARFGTSVQALVQINGLQDPDWIFYGRKLKVPALTDQPANAVAPVSP